MATMLLLDALDEPSGRELVTQRPAWRVRLETEQESWAFVEQQGNQLLITGYPTYQVEPVAAARQPAAGAIVGAGAGALLGGALGGPAGALIGGFIGMILVASGSAGSK